MHGCSSGCSEYLSKFSFVFKEQTTEVKHRVVCAPAPGSRLRVALLSTGARF